MILTVNIISDNLHYFKQLCKNTLYAIIIDIHREKTTK